MYIYSKLCQKFSKSRHTYKLLIFTRTRVNRLTLKTNKIKTTKFLTTLAFAAVILFSGCRKDDYVAIPAICPTVISTEPANGDVNVPLSQVITATFNEKINFSTFNSTTFAVSGAAKITGTLSYDENSLKVSFTPAVPLILNTTYTCRIASAVKDQAGNALPADYIWTFSTGASILPIMVSSDPESNATGIVLNKTISAAFNIPMDPLSFTASTFFVKQGINSIPGSFAYNGVTAYFIPAANFTSNTVYTATITTGVNSATGTALASTYTWNFTTGSIVAPKVILTDPLNNANEVVLNKSVAATFSEPMNPATINSATFTVRLGSSIAAGTITYSGSTAVFTPKSGYLQGSTYTATISTGAKNTSGVSLANNYVWVFNTLIAEPQVTSTDPANNATGVPLNKIMEANFNVAMAPLTLNASTFTVKQGTNSISGTVSYSGTKASFQPTTALLSNLLYTATITTGAKSVNGSALRNNYTWTFTTGTSIAPTVVLTDPLNNATGVALNKTLSATFSMAMDPLTINGTTFFLKQGANTINGAVSYTGTSAFFKPNNNLTAGLVYTATITTGAKNVAGTPLANNYVWSFTSLAGSAPQVTSTDPLNNATGVLLNKIITASFNMNMDALTINSGSFTLKLGTSSVAGSVSYSGTTATFTPSSNLLSDNTYTATITTSAKNTSGTPLANNYIWTFSTKAHAGPQAPELKSVERFGIISGVGVSNNAGFSIINNMDVGIYPGNRTAITGFPPAKVVNGAIYAADDLLPAGVGAMLKQAKADLTAAYNYAAGASSPSPATVSGDLGGTTLSPGIYKTTSTLGIASGDLTLDAKGDPNAVWIFQVASGFTTKGGAGGNVILSGGAQAKNVYWQVGSSATIGDNTSFYGNILAYTSITMNSKAVATGRMLAINAAVVMTNTNTINKP